MQSYGHDGGDVRLLQVGVQLLLDLGDLVDVLDGDGRVEEVSRHRRELLLPGGLLQEPAGLGWLYDELEGAVGEGSEFDLEGYVASDVRGYLIELLAELHHVDSQRTQGLTHFGVGLRHSREHSKIHSC